MRSDSQLRRRLALMLAACALAVACLLPFSLWLSGTLLSTAPIQDLLVYDALILGQRAAPGLSVDTGRSALRYYRPRLGGGEPLPPELQALAPGWYREVRVGADHVAVQVREIAPGDRSYLAYDIDYLRHMERSLWMLVMSLAAFSGLVVWAFARRMVDRALDPLSHLLREIQALIPGRHGQVIALPIRDRELAVIVEALNRFLGQIDELVERERTFAAAASHELRTPLTVVQGAVQALEDAPQVSERLRLRLGRAVQELRHDLDALLALSQTQDAPAPQPLDLGQWLPQLAEAHAPAAQLAWHVAAPVTLHAPPGVLNIIFSNLLRNAVRAAAGGPVRIEIGSDAVVVTDSGPGMPAEALLSAFKPRFRGHDGGSGMGLYIAKTLAQRYGWRLHLANVPGGGVRAELGFAPARGGR